MRLLFGESCSADVRLAPTPAPNCGGFVDGVGAWKGVNGYMGGLSSHEDDRMFSGSRHRHIQKHVKTNATTREK